MASLARRVKGRMDDWWQRVAWGGAVIIGPILCYVALLIALDVVGLSDGQARYFDAALAVGSFKSGLELDLYSISGRSEYALTAAVYVLVAVFSIVWAAPRIAAKTRNPYGGGFGVMIAVGLSLALYVLYVVSDNNLRIAFADQILAQGEAVGVLERIPMKMQLLGVTLFGDSVPASEMLAKVHAFVYFFGNAAPWFLIVFAACCAAFEPGSFGKERHKSLRERMALLQIAVALGAANIVLSVAYLRAMLNWPTNLLEDQLAADFIVATTRYTAIWGAIGTLMLIAVVAPAYISLTRHFDRVAEFERLRDGDDYVSYKERREWREEHGLNLTSQEILATGAAVLAPLLTAPTLETADAAANQPQPVYEYRIE